MDAHYSKVMKAREEISETGSRFYFAYSGVLDQEAFNQWKVEHSYHFFDLPKGQLAKIENMELIFDFPSRWWGGRVAGLTEKTKSEVYGLLFEIPVKNWPVVQHKEGVITGMSVEKKVQVKMGDKTIDAIAFTTSPMRASLEGLVSQAYVEALIRGATQAGLPDFYVKSLVERAK